MMSLVLLSCEVIPEAAFYVDKVEAEVGEEIFFTNDSYNADRFEWDFGDGTFSDVPNPAHTYRGTGTFEVKLTVFTHRGVSDYSYKTIVIKSPTLLEVEVLEYYDEYPVKNASVLIYPTLAAWDEERNSIAEGFTNADGKVVFTGLGDFVYYLDVWEKDHNNYSLRQEDINFIKTGKIKLNQINRFIAYVDYVGSKGDAKKDRSVVIKKIVPRVYGYK
jgi:PKD repeat protein